MNIKVVERLFVVVISLVCSYVVFPFVIDFIFKTKMLNWAFEYIGFVISFAFIIGSIGFIFSIVKCYLSKEKKYFKTLKMSLILVFISFFVFYIIASGLH